MENVERIIKKAGQMIIEGNGADEITEKGRYDYVTETDKKVQEYIITSISELFPEAYFIAEEKENEILTMEKSTWILDPVDGTLNLIHNLRFSGISLAYAEEGEIKYAAIYNPYSEELFTAEKGKGAWLDGSRINARNVTSTEECIASVGTSSGNRVKSGLDFENMRNIFECCRDIRRLGSASLELAYIACGRIDFFVERNLKLWDYAAGMLIVTEAGGCFFQDDTVTAAGGSGVFRKFMDKIKL